MNGIIDWAGAHARMVLAFIALTLLAGILAYTGLPKEGEPDLEIPGLYISVPFAGISAADSEELIVKPIEQEMSDLDGLKSMNGTAAEGYGAMWLEFEFGWDKPAILAEVRDRMSTVEANLPDGADKYSISEVNFSQFPIIIVNLTGEVPERTLVRVAKEMQDRLEGLEPVLEATMAGSRDEMVEVLIDPLRLEAYNVTAQELIQVVTQNNQLIAAGDIETDQGVFPVKIPATFEDLSDIYALPVKVNGDRVITLGDLAEIRLTFEDRTGTARYNGEPAVALQIVKRKGFNIIDTSALVKQEVEAEVATWPEELRAAIHVGVSNDQSVQVGSMVAQLEGSVMTAIALVMIVVLAALGTRSALLVGFAIPTSFLLTFILLGLLQITISNIVMFALILAVGMLVDGAIVVVEYADRRINEGAGPMQAFTDAAKRMFWPIVSSTATTLCAFLPMLFWPGVAGEFMGLLPVTIIFVLSASLIVALIYLPVMGGVAGRITRMLDRASDRLRARLPWWLRAVLVLPAMALMFVSAMQLINPGYLFGGTAPVEGALGLLPGFVMFVVAAAAGSITLGAARIERAPRKVQRGHRRTPFGHFIKAIVGNPVMPLVTIAAVVFAVISVFAYYGENNNGTSFIDATEPEQAIVYVRARGNLSLAEKDALVRQAEAVVMSVPGVESAFAFAGQGGLNQNTGGAQGPRDTIGQIQLELVRWEDRKDNPEMDGDLVLSRIEQGLAGLPGIKTEILNLSMGPASAKPVHLRLTGDDWGDLREATEIAQARFEATPGLTDTENTLPLPGIDWEISVDVEKAGRYGADVATVGGMVQLITRGLLLDTMRVDSSDEEVEIRVRLPEDDRVLATLDSLRVRTADGLVPMSNFITREPVPQLASISRVDQERYFDVKAGVAADLVKLVDGDGAVVDTVPAAEAETGPLAERIASEGLKAVPLTATERIETLTAWIEDEAPFPESVSWQWTGDFDEQAESQEFLSTAFAGALGLMFIILLAQFNSLYNSVLVLLAVVLSVAGVLIGTLVMDQSFSVIMTGTGIVALAGIVVNNNIVLIDTYQEYSAFMPRIEAIIRTAETRIRPVLLTTITTMAGLAPMMFGLSLDFINGGYSIDSPTAAFWKQLAAAVVFGLGTATLLTLLFTPAMLALRVWFAKGTYGMGRRLQALAGGRDGQLARDLALEREARRIKTPEILWDPDDYARAGTDPALAPPEAESDAPRGKRPRKPRLRAAE